MSLKTPVPATLAFGMLVVLAGCTSGAKDNGDGSMAEPPSEALEAVPMVSHIAFGVFEMDVFIEASADPGMVVRPTPDDAASPLTKEAPLYGTQDMTPHDPTFSIAGPFDQGEALGVNLAQWLAATGSAAYLCTGGTTARADATFSRLVPNGVYTFWNARLDFTDGAITGGADIPLGAPDGSQTAFRADASGNARVSATWAGCNEPSTGGPGVGPNGSARVFAIAYHSDGQTYGATPGPFGQRTHVQLFGFVKGAAA